MWLAEARGPGGALTLGVTCFFYKEIQELFDLISRNVCVAVAGGVSRGRGYRDDRVVSHVTTCFTEVDV